MGAKSSKAHALVKIGADRKQMDKTIEAQYVPEKPKKKIKKYADARVNIKEIALRDESCLYAICLKYYREKILTDPEEVIAAMAKHFGQGHKRYDIHMDMTLLPPNTNSKKLSMTLIRIMNDDKFARDIRNTYGNKFWISVFGDKKCECGYCLVGSAGLGLEWEIWDDISSETY